MPAENAFLDFIRRTAVDLQKETRPPKSRDEWSAFKLKLRAKLQTAFGPFPQEPCDLAVKKFGEIQRDGYTIEKIAIQTRTGVWMPANVYVPSGSGKRAAVLNVHGHWKGAKQDEHVQARCIGLAQLGFIAMAVDAFGAGERGVGTALGEYHGEMTAATLLPTGLPLAGLQIYENSRAVDYLQSRADVDGEKLGITGASGGGNQTMYAGAWDERFKAVVPVCSVGNYQAYLGTACCMCEVVPSALQFTEEWAILGMVAPRALLVVSATKDAHQFSVGEAKKSLALATPVFELLDVAKNIRHATFESPHDYNQAMREAMYGWMKLHLSGEGDGSPIAEKPQKLDPPELLRCWPGDERDKEYVTIPRFAAAVGRELVKQKPLPDHLEFWESEAYQIREGLARVLGPEPEEGPLRLMTSELDQGIRLLQFDTEPGLRIAAKHLPGESKNWVILVDSDGMNKAAESELAKSLQKADWNVVCVDLRATGDMSVAGDQIGRAPDHNSAEWSLWIGRPLVGQWARDIRRTLDAVLESIDTLPDEVALVGVGSASIAALLAGVQEDAFKQVALASPLTSYISDAPFQSQRLGTMIPGVLRSCGDVAHLAALLAPRPLFISGGVQGDGKEQDTPQLEEAFAYTRKIYAIRRAAKRLVLSAKLAPAALAEELADL